MQSVSATFSFFFFYNVRAKLPGTFIANSEWEGCQLMI